VLLLAKDRFALTLPFSNPLLGKNRFSLLKLAFSPQAAFVIASRLTQGLKWLPSLIIA
jgi:hypothetical protein